MEKKIKFKTFIGSNGLIVIGFISLFFGLLFYINGEKNLGLPFINFSGLFLILWFLIHIIINYRYIFNKG